MKLMILGEFNNRQMWNSSVEACGSSPFFSLLEPGTMRPHPSSCHGNNPEVLPREGKKEAVIKQREVRFVFQPPIAPPSTLTHSPVITSHRRARERKLSTRE